MIEIKIYLVIIILSICISIAFGAQEKKIQELRSRVEILEARP